MILMPPFLMVLFRNLKGEYEALDRHANFHLVGHGQRKT